MSAQRRADKPTIATAPRGAGAGNVPTPPARKPATPPVPARGAKPAPQRPEQKTPSVAANRIENLKKSYYDTVAELKKVNWPDRETTRNLTIVVIALSIVLGILLGGLDFVLQRIFEAVA
jgi:preprotein translocase subunit SecE